MHSFTYVNCTQRPCIFASPNCNTIAYLVQYHSRDVVPKALEIRCHPRVLVLPTAVSSFMVVCFWYVVNAYEYVRKDIPSRQTNRQDSVSDRWRKCLKVNVVREINCFKTRARRISAPARGLVSGLSKYKWELPNSISLWCLIKHIELCRTFQICHSVRGISGVDPSATCTFNSTYWQQYWSLNIEKYLFDVTMIDRMLIDNAHWHLSSRIILVNVTIKLNMYDITIAAQLGHRKRHVHFSLVPSKRLNKGCRLWS